MVTHAHPRDFQALEQRRKQAALLFAKGGSKLASVARQLKASRQSVGRWYHDWRQGGTKALKAAGRAGRKARLSPAQLRKVEVALLQGAEAHGFGAELWTLPRVATVIERVTGVQFHPGHVWKILGSINWTVQKPTQQAKERSEEQVEYWKTVRWPELKKRCTREVVDLLPRRIRRHPEALSPHHLGPQREDPGLEVARQSLE